MAVHIEKHGVPVTPYSPFAQVVIKIDNTKDLVILRGLNGFVSASDCVFSFVCARHFVYKSSI